MDRWTDWMDSDAPDPVLLSRDELLDQLRQAGITISPYTLEHYRRSGVLPRPVRVRHNGVTQAVYPSWFVDAIQHLKKLQSAGRTLEQIKPYMRQWADTGAHFSEHRECPHCEGTGLIHGRFFRAFRPEDIENAFTDEIEWGL